MKCFRWSLWAWYIDQELFVVYFILSRLVARDLGIVFYWTFALRQCSLFYICCFGVRGFYWYCLCVILLNCCLWVFLYAFPLGYGLACL